MTLLELVIASSMMALVMTTVMVVLRTGRQAWDAHEGDYVLVESAHATLRHIVRQIRQAEAVADIDEVDTISSQLTLQMPAEDPDPVTCVWLHQHGNEEVAYDRYVGAVGTPTDLLSPGITDVTFTGLEANGLTATADETKMQCVRVDVVIELPRTPKLRRTISSHAWIRSW